MMDIKKEKKAIKNLKAHLMDEWELTEEQKDEFDDLVFRVFAVGKEEAKAQAVPKGFVLVKDEPIAYMVQNKFWKGEFEVKLLSNMPEPEFEGDSYDIEIPLYSIQTQEQTP